MALTLQLSLALALIAGHRSTFVPLSNLRTAHFRTASPWALAPWSRDTLGPWVPSGL
jgi:hypothetical protein